MRKKIIIPSAIVFAVLLILFLPVPYGTLNDGGTRVYSALTYKIVAWNRFMPDSDERYRNTSVYWFSDSMKDIDELWRLEYADDAGENKDTVKGSVLLRDENVTQIDVSSLPEGYAYSFSGISAMHIIEYLSGLNLSPDFPENPNEYSGMTWVIEIGYENGETLNIYHFGNMFIRADGGDWYRMDFDEASHFDALLEELN